MEANAGQLKAAPENGRMLDIAAVCETENQQEDGRMAFVRIGQFKAIPDKADDLRSIYEGEAIPIIRAARGNISAVLLKQHEARDSFMAITLWESAADA